MGAPARARRWPASCWACCRWAPSRTASAAVQARLRPPRSCCPAGRCSSARPGPRPPPGRSCSAWRRCWPAPRSRRAPPGTLLAPLDALVREVSLGAASHACRPLRLNTYLAPRLRIPGQAASRTGMFSWCTRFGRALRLRNSARQQDGGGQCNAAAHADSAGCRGLPGSSSMATALAGSTRWRPPRPPSAPRRTRARARGAASWSSAPLPCRRARAGPALRLRRTRLCGLAAGRQHPDRRRDGQSGVVCCRPV